MDPANSFSASRLEIFIRLVLLYLLGGFNPV
jgi:hypothetical protein